MAELLDNPIWHALTTEQVHLATRDGDAARFPPEMTALAGLRAPAAVSALPRLLGAGRTAGLLVEWALDLPDGLALVDEAPALQMVHDGPAPEMPAGLEQLGPADAPSMLALAEATRPGPFGLRTGELGVFLGIRAGGQVIAMAGQRMRLPGLIEVSGVCTDPGHLGRGYGARLLAGQIALIRGDGQGVFLHVKADNGRAIALYERLGFRARRQLRYLIVRAVPLP